MWKEEFLRQKSNSMRKSLSVVLSVSCLAGVLFTASAQTSNGQQRRDVSCEMIPVDSAREVLFYFVPKTSMFFYDINEVSIKEAGEMIQRHRSEIELGDMFISVNGFCSSFRTEYSNYKMARIRSNQVKSYYITNYGMKEEYYITKNYTGAYNGDKDVVAMLKLVRLKKADSLSKAPSVSSVGEDAVPNPVNEPIDTVQTELSVEPREPSVAAESEIAAETGPAAEPEEAPEADTAVCREPDPATVALPSPGRPDVWDKSRWSIKTNIPAWAFVVTNVAAEYRFADHWSVDVPLYYSSWTTARTYRFRILAVQPSVRYWLGSEWKGHFFGAHLTAGQFNISVDEHTRYQDVNGMYGVGVDYGYALKFSEHWGLEFNVGAGYIGTRYNSYYNISDGARFDTSVKNYWGITRCGISLIYRIK